jgi:acetolactate synthase-1/2/3 large subunit
MKRAHRSDLAEVVVDREIRPVGTGTWVLPPLPHPEPNSTRLARIK